MSKPVLDPGPGHHSDGSSDPLDSSVIIVEGGVDPTGGGTLSSLVLYQSSDTSGATLHDYVLSAYLAAPPGSSSGGHSQADPAGLEQLHGGVVTVASGGDVSRSEERR